VFGKKGEALIAEALRCESPCAEADDSRAKNFASQVFRGKEKDRSNRGLRNIEKKVDPEETGRHPKVSRRGAGEGGSLDRGDRHNSSKCADHAKVHLRKLAAREGDILEACVAEAMVVVPEVETRFSKKGSRETSALKTT